MSKRFWLLCEVIIVGLFVAVGFGQTLWTAVQVLFG